MSDPFQPAPQPEINLNYETPPRHGSAPMLVRLAGIFNLVSAGIDLLYAVCMISMAVFMYYTFTRFAAGGFVVAPAPAPPVMVAPMPPVAPPALPAALPGGEPLPESAPAPSAVPGAGPILPEPAPAPMAPAAVAPALPGPPAAGPVVPAPAPVPVPLPMSQLYMMLATYGGPGILSLLVVAPKIIGGVKLLRRGKRGWGWGLASGIIGCVQVWMIMPCCVTLFPPIAVGIYTIVILCLPHVRLFLTPRSMQ